MDMELGNFLTGIGPTEGNSAIASRLLLSRIAGFPKEPGTTSHCQCAMCRQTRQAMKATAAATGGAIATEADYNPQDVGRRFLAQNGGCIYIDLDHLELAMPEVLDAYDHVACCRAMLAIAQQAQAEINGRLAAGKRLTVLVNNSDGLGNSYGSHLNILLSRPAWDNVFHRKMHQLLYLASFQVASIVLTGQGKVGAENGTPAVAYQLAQRPDFIETMVGIQTTFRRPIVNARDESLTGSTVNWRKGGADGDANPYGRLHVIFYDNNLCQVAALLKVGLLQIIAAMIEAECVNTKWLLEDPVAAVVRYSHDPTLRAGARLTSGESLTAVDLLRHFLDDMQAFVERGETAGLVPHAAEILHLADDTLQKLAAGDLGAVSGRLDWVLKAQILERAMQRRPQLTWASPQLKHLDHLYSSLDPDEGLFWAFERQGAVESVVSPERVQHFVHEPPADTRAYTRAMLLRRTGGAQVSLLDWDRIDFRMYDAESWATGHRIVDMPDPLRLTKPEMEHMFADATRSLGDILEELAPRRVVRLGRVDRTKRDADEEAAGPVRRSAPLVDSETTSFGTRN
jgi:proteasome accessory factor A